MKDRNNTYKLISSNNDSGNRLSSIIECNLALVIWFRFISRQNSWLSLYFRETLSQFFISIVSAIKVMHIKKERVDRRSWTISAMVCVVIITSLPITSLANILPSEILVSKNQYGSYVWTGATVSSGGNLGGTQVPPNGRSDTYTTMKMVSTGSTIYPWGEVDGVWGILLAPNVILTFEGTSDRAIYNYRYADSKWLLGLNPTIVDKNGKTLKKIQNAAGPTYWEMYNDNAIWTNISQDQSVNYSLTPKIYVGAGGFIGTTVVNGLGVSLEYPNFTKNVNIISGSTTFINPPSPSCTVSAPPTIDFGSVNPIGMPGNSVLNVRTQGLNVDCASDSSSAIGSSVYITASGAAMSGYPRRLGLFNDSGKLLAYLRGRTGEGAGECGGHKDELSFDSSVKNSIPDLVVGSNYIPLTWTLCSDGSEALGHGTAQATVTVNWD